LNYDKCYKHELQVYTKKASLEFKVGDIIKVTTVDGNGYFVLVMKGKNNPFTTEAIFHITTNGSHRVR